MIFNLNRDESIIAVLNTNRYTNSFVRLRYNQLSTLDVKFSCSYLIGNVLRKVN
jgi:hypothetical protein